MLKTIVGFLSREHGLNVLKTLIEKNIRTEIQQYIVDTIIE